MSRTGQTRGKQETTLGAHSYPVAVPGARVVSLWISLGGSWAPLSLAQKALLGTREPGSVAFLPKPQLSGTSIEETSTT